MKADELVGQKAGTLAALLVVQMVDTMAAKLVSQWAVMKAVK